MSPTNDRTKLFFDHVSFSRGCCEWIGYKNRDGYGIFGARANRILAHRYAYMALSGDVPKGLCVLHSCDNPSCVNPSHLFLGTQEDNMKDMGRKKRGRNQFS